MSRELTTLSRLCTLRNFDLNVISIHEIVTRHAKAAGRDLLDRTTSKVAVGVGGEPLFVLSPFAGVGLGSKPVHGYC